MDTERRQRDAGLPLLGRREALPSRLPDATPGADEPGQKGAEPSKKRSHQRRARARSAGRARVVLVLGSVLAAIGLGAGMWVAADNSGTAQGSATEPAPAEAGASLSQGAAEVPPAPDVTPAPSDSASQGRSGAS